MSTHFISPYDRPDSVSDTKALLALVGSLVLHVLVFWLFIFVLPGMGVKKASWLDNVITVELFGSLLPPAPAAPADLPVNPERKGPDVVEAPQADPIPPPVNPFTPSVPEPAPAQTDVIPLGPKAPEKPPEIKKAVSPPPKVEVPKVEPPKPPPVKKPANNKGATDAAINKRLAELERNREARQRDEAIEAKMWNLENEHARGDGAGSGSSGTAQGAQTEKDRYYARIVDIVASNWVTPSGALDSNIIAIYAITIDPSGKVTTSRLIQSSGNSAYDLSVERAVLGSVFPPLPDVFEGQTISPAFRFNSDKMRRSAVPN